MQGYRRSSHTIFDIRYHLVWITKYRYKVLTGDIAIRVRDTIREICREHDVEILKGHVSKDHVHVYLSGTPDLPVSKLAQYLKGKTSRRIQMEFPVMKKRYWGKHIWARGYFVATVGEISDELIRQYIENQEHHHHEDDFKVDA